MGSQTVPNRPSRRALVWPVDINGLAFLFARRIRHPFIRAA
jgi:hypothetical protein